MSDNRAHATNEQAGFAATFVHPVTGVVACERRRSGGDRRQRLLWSLFYGGVRPQRLGGRRASDHHRPVVDWHGPGLLTSAIFVLLLCVADAFLTLKLLTLGATEANPVMALWVYDDVESFAIAKMALTGCGLLALVAVARFRVFGVLRVASLVHAVLAAYVVVIGYSLTLFTKLI